MIEQTRFLSTVFLCSEFKLENIYSGVNFCGKNVCGNFYLRELIFADRWKKTQKSQKLEPAKISCHTVCDNIAKIMTKMGVLASYFIEN